MRRAILWLGFGFLSNGLAQFFMKYLHVIGLGAYQAAALIVMYAAGALFALGLLAGFHGRVRRGELIAGAAVGPCSYLGNYATFRALGSLPAYTVFPIVVGGPIVAVALYVWLVHGERTNWSAKLGIVCGFIAVVLLTV